VFVSSEVPEVFPLGSLLRIVKRHPVAARLHTAAERGTALTVAVPDCLRALWLAALPEQVGRPVVGLLATDAEVERVSADIACFRPPPLILPAWETLPYEHVSPSMETMGSRLAAFRAFAGDSPPPLTLLPARALLQRVLPDVSDVPVIEFTVGDRIDFDEVLAALVAMGYERSYLVEARGEFAVRGGILDIYPATYVQPLRVELWGDEIEAIRQFSVSDQRSVGTSDKVEILPCREVRPTAFLRGLASRLSTRKTGPRGGIEAFAKLADGQFFPGMESWLPWLLDEFVREDAARQKHASGQKNGQENKQGDDVGPGGAEVDKTFVAAHLPPNALVVVCDAKRCRDRSLDLQREEEDLADALSETWQLPHIAELGALSQGGGAGDVLDPRDARTDVSGRNGARSRPGRTRGKLIGDVAGVLPVQSLSESISLQPGVPSLVQQSGGSSGEVPVLVVQDTSIELDAGFADAVPDGNPERFFPPRLFLDPETALNAPDLLVWQTPAIPDSMDTLQYQAAPAMSFHGHSEQLAEHLKQFLAEGMRVVVASDGEGVRHRLHETLQAEGLTLREVDGPLDLSAPDRGVMVVAPFSRGFISREIGLVVLAPSDLAGRRRVHRPARTMRHRKGVSGAVYGDLREGDYVVHYQHGVGRFSGMAERGIGGVTREYLVLVYAKDDKLYVPVDQVDAVRKYVGGDTPRLSRLGGADWARAKGKVRKAVAEIADELVELYKTRLCAKGRASSPDGEMMQDLAESFPFEETLDQRNAISVVLQDMESAVPMDRLVCGDVGFGKTEIAVRAAMKALADGRQVAVLVPTTILAQQHFQTFSERFAAFPLRVEMLSRFLTSAEQKRVVADTELGKVDILVGTHRLLSQDIAFADLGLLVVDEEQRFGVKAKERLKELRLNVDVLTLTATPIPRTLEFALTGIRDMSMVTTPPQDRQPVLTYVGEFDEQVIAAAIRRELLRDGQVFYVHNRVQSIERAAAAVQNLVPEARIGIAHGQMPESVLEKTMMAFLDGEYDLLCSTTIVESGLDISRANTLIVERADLLGLAQMYQLRGRVGRSERRAYAYLFYPEGRILTEEAYERLKVIAEHQDLGSGFAIAMRDLEIRGAGNLLGATQSGHIVAVGFDLYCQLVNEAVAAFKGETVVEPAQVRIDLPVEAYIPDSYMPKESLRLEAYRRLADAADEEGIADVRDEWEDRYGLLPEEVDRLLDLAKIKLLALSAGVTEILFVRDRVTLKGLVPTGSKRMRFHRLHRDAVIKEEAKTLVVPYRNPALIGRGAGARATVSGKHVAGWTADLLQELS